MGRDQLESDMPMRVVFPIDLVRVALSRLYRCAHQPHSATYCSCCMIVGRVRTRGQPRRIARDRGHAHGVPVLDERPSFLNVSCSSRRSILVTCCRPFRRPTSRSGDAVRGSGRDSGFSRQQWFVNDKITRTRAARSALPRTDPEPPALIEAGVGRPRHVAQRLALHGGQLQHGSR